jgi:hypothetical protein
MKQEMSIDSMTTFYNDLMTKFNFARDNSINSFKEINGNFYRNDDIWVEEIILKNLKRTGDTLVIRLKDTLRCRHIRLKKIEEEEKEEEKEEKPMFEEDSIYINKEKPMFEKDSIYINPQ